MASGWIECHCGQRVPAYMAGMDRHFTPRGGLCVGIREELHVPSICLECSQGTHDPSFMVKLEMIRSERIGT